MTDRIASASATAYLHRIGGDGVGEVLDDGTDLPSANLQEFVKIAYLALLGRDPEHGVTDFYIDLFEAGRLTYMAFVKGVMQSDEYKTRLERLTADANGLQIRPLWSELLDGF